MNITLHQFYSRGHGYPNPVDFLYLQCILWLPAFNLYQRYDEFLSNSKFSCKSLEGYYTRK